MLERVKGVEPSTFALATRRTTTVLHPHGGPPLLTRPASKPTPEGAGGGAVERQKGIEPSTFWLGTRCSTTELLSHGWGARTRTGYSRARTLRDSPFTTPHGSPRRI